MESVCKVCAEPPKGRCELCLEVAYCSQACMDADWDGGHRDECIGAKIDTQKDYKEGVMAFVWRMLQGQTMPPHEISEHAYGYTSLKDEFIDMLAQGDLKAIEFLAFSNTLTYTGGVGTLQTVKTFFRRLVPGLSGKESIFQDYVRKKYGERCDMYTASLDSEKLADARSQTIADDPNRFYGRLGIQTHRYSMHREQLRQSAQPGMTMEQWGSRQGQFTILGTSEYDPDEQVPRGFEAPLKRAVVQLMITGASERGRVPVNPNIPTVLFAYANPTDVSSYFVRLPILRDVLARDLPPELLKQVAYLELVTEDYGIPLTDVLSNYDRGKRSSPGGLSGTVDQYSPVAEFLIFNNLVIPPTGLAVDGADVTTLITQILERQVGVLPGTTSVYDILGITFKDGHYIYNNDTFKNYVTNSNSSVPTFQHLQYFAALARLYQVVDPTGGQNTDMLYRLAETATGIALNGYRFYSNLRDDSDDANLLNEFKFALSLFRDRPEIVYSNEPYVLVFIENLVQQVVYALAMLETHFSCTLGNIGVETIYVKPVNQALCPFFTYEFDDTAGQRQTRQIRNVGFKVMIPEVENCFLEMQLGRAQYQVKSKSPLDLAIVEHADVLGLFQSGRRYHQNANPQRFHKGHDLGLFMNSVSLRHNYGMDQHPIVLKYLDYERLEHVRTYQSTRNYRLTSLDNAIDFSIARKLRSESAENMREMLLNAVGKNLDAMTKQFRIDEDLEDALRNLYTSLLQLAQAFATVKRGGTSQGDFRDQFAAWVSRYGALAWRARAVWNDSLRLLETIDFEQLSEGPLRDLTIQLQQIATDKVTADKFNQLMSYAVGVTTNGVYGFFSEPTVVTLLKLFASLLTTARRLVALASVDVSGPVDIAQMASALVASVLKGIAKSHLAQLLGDMFKRTLARLLDAEKIMLGAAMPSALTLLSPVKFIEQAPFIADDLHPSELTPDLAKEAWSSFFNALYPVLRTTKGPFPMSGRGRGVFVEHGKDIVLADSKNAEKWRTQKDYMDALAGGSGPNSVLGGIMTLIKDPSALSDEIAKTIKQSNLWLGGGNQGSAFGAWTTVAGGRRERRAIKVTGVINDLSRFTPQQIDEGAVITDTGLNEIFVSMVTSQLYVAGTSPNFMQYYSAYIADTTGVEPASRKSSGDDGPSGLQAAFQEFVDLLLTRDGDMMQTLQAVLQPLLMCVGEWILASSADTLFWMALSKVKSMFTQLLGQQPGLQFDNLQSAGKQYAETVTSFTSKYAALLNPGSDAASSAMSKTKGFLESTFLSMYAAFKWVWEVDWLKGLVLFRCANRALGMLTQTVGRPTKTWMHTVVENAVLAIRQEIEGTTVFLAMAKMIEETSAQILESKATTTAGVRKEYRFIQVMEAIDSDMQHFSSAVELLQARLAADGRESIPTFHDYLDNAVAQIVCALAQFQDYLQGMHTDFHAENVMIKFCDETLFNGRPLHEYDFFDYKINGETIRIPNLGFVVKIADLGLSSVNLLRTGDNGSIDLTKSQKEHLKLKRRKAKKANAAQPKDHYLTLHTSKAEGLRAIFEHDITWMESLLDLIVEQTSLLRSATRVDVPSIAKRAAGRLWLRAEGAFVPTFDLAYIMNSLAMLPHTYRSRIVHSYHDMESLKQLRENGTLAGRLEYSPYIYAPGQLDFASPIDPKSQRVTPHEFIQHAVFHIYRVGSDGLNEFQRTSSSPVIEAPNWENNTANLTMLHKSLTREMLDAEKRFTNKLDAEDNLEAALEIIRRDGKIMQSYLEAYRGWSGRTDLQGSETHYETQSRIALKQKTESKKENFKNEYIRKRSKDLDTMLSNLDKMRLVSWIEQSYYDAPAAASAAACFVCARPAHYTYGDTYLCSDECLGKLA